ncbi:MAG: cupin domain-containing protein [Nitrospirota bacterium]|jgi:cupin 2 domain-containing protein
MAGALDPANLLHDIPARQAQEWVEVLAHGDAMRIERIVSWGQHSPVGFWYDQEEHEWVALLRGAARLRFEDGDRVVTLAPGDSLTIPAHVRHRVEWTDPERASVWLAVFFR